jgi:hypothetical protein
MTSTSGVRRQALSTIPELRGRKGVWLVGGAVRDHLLDRPVLDLDFAVSGPAAPLARRGGQPARPLLPAGSSATPPRAVDRLQRRPTPVRFTLPCAEDDEDDLRA